MPIPADYAERVYAGVLGKMIGVYLGRPFENWTFSRIETELGEVDSYVHERLGVPLVVPDDDLSGTFSFLRALEDHGFDRNISAADIGSTWLNYLIEERTVLWWGGLGNSTEHTAYLRLKAGVHPPRSGSSALNGKIVAEQIGSQIFIDGWGMVAPGDPELAADLSRKAASVSHDGEAIFAAQVIAVMEAMAFVEPNLERLLEVASTFIPQDSVIFRLIEDLRTWHSEEPDWRKTRARIEAEYGYERYGGNVHIVPNHAIVLLGLLYGNGDFQRSLMITNTAGWDTDCNSGNVGCLLGIKLGLRAFESGPDWRGPVADRLYLPTADGGRAITDALTEAGHVTNAGRALAGLEALRPKAGSRFHFSQPGSVQGFRVAPPSASCGELRLLNECNEAWQGKRGLALHYKLHTETIGVRAGTPTFIPPNTDLDSSYALVASPTLHSGQEIHAELLAHPSNEGVLETRLYVEVYGSEDGLVRSYGNLHHVSPGAQKRLDWRVPDTHGAPIAEVGVEVVASHAKQGSVLLERLTWDGAPECVLGQSELGGTMWQRAWVNAMDVFETRPRWPETYRLIQNRGRGLLIQGNREWKDYAVEAQLTPVLATAFGIGARVQGLIRYSTLR